MLGASGLPAFGCLGFAASGRGSGSGLTVWGARVYGFGLRP